MVCLMGSQVPRFLVAPTPRGYESLGLEACRLVAGLGLVADPWQETTLEAWMRREGDRWCASTWGVTVSRQNGKNGSLEVVEVFGMVALGLKFLHTAHEVKTARKAFARLKYFFGEKANDPNAKFPKLNAFVVEVRNTNGQEAILLRNGGSIEFIARSKGSGRGYTVDVLVLDESQELQDHELEALLPTISAAPSGDPVTIYMGTPPKGDSELGDPFIRVRDSAIDGTAKRTAWVEFSADGYVEDMSEAELVAFVRRRKNWADANPALGWRINEATIEAELTQFSARSFARERLNMWPKPGAALSAVPERDWLARAIGEVPESWPLAAVGVDMNPDRTRVTLSVAVWSPDGVHVELAEDAPFDESGTKALVEWLWKRCRRRIPVVMDAFTPIRSIEAELKQKGMKVRVLSSAELSQACGGFFDAVVKDKSLTHFDQGALNDSLAGAVKQKFGDGGAWKWNRKSLEVDLTPTMAATCAHFGAIKFGKRKSFNSDKQKAVIL